MIRILLLACVAVLCGCETVQKRAELEPIENGRRIEIREPVTIIETRGPLALKLQWQLLPGVYVERYRGEVGRFYESLGELVEFTPTMGDKTRSVGGFVILRERKGFGKLYIIRRGEVAPHHGPVGTAIAKMVVGPAGDYSLVTEFPLSRLRGTKEKK